MIYNKIGKYLSFTELTHKVTIWTVHMYTHTHTDTYIHHPSRPTEVPERIIFVFVVDRNHIDKNKERFVTVNII